MATRYISLYLTEETLGAGTTRQDLHRYEEFLRGRLAILHPSADVRVHYFGGETEIQSDWPEGENLLVEKDLAELLREFLAS